MIAYDFTLRKFKLVLVFLLGLLLLAACGSSASTTDSAPGAVEAYFRALAAKDENSLSTLSCADWEALARDELNSFGAVTTELQDVACQESGQDGAAILISCTGSLQADYNGEILSIDLAGRTYQAVEEGGEWRMCGYR